MLIRWLRAAIASLRDQEHLAKSVTANEQGKLYLIKNLKTWFRIYLTEANFIMFNVRRDANTLFEELLKKELLFVQAVFLTCRYIR